MKQPPGAARGTDALDGKALRDPVHNLITFDGPDLALLQVIDCREMQRLRWIRQLGVCFLAYPGTEHSRFSHSIGVYHVMKRLLATLMPLTQAAGAPSFVASNLRFPPSLRLDDLASPLAMAAKAYALLHDVGHGPFSHLFERVFDTEPSNATPLHERWSLRLVTDDASTLGATIRERLGQEVYDNLVELMAHRHPATYISSLVSSQLDADRFDYLMRDNLASGTTYGFYDLDWILRSLRLVQREAGEWVVAVDGRKGLYAIEQYLLARRNMYQQVYLHKTTRTAETMVLCVLERLRERVRHRPELAVALGLPAGLTALCLGRQPTVDEYLELDDATLWHLFKAWSRSVERAGDPVLHDLCARLVGRKLFKAVELTAKQAQALHGDSALRRALEGRVAERLRIDPEVVPFYLRLDTVETQPYDERDEPIWLTYGGTSTGRADSQPQLIALRDHPQMASLLSGSVAPHRMIVADEVRADVVELLHQ